MNTVAAMSHLVALRHGITDINEWNRHHSTNQKIGGQLESQLLPEGEEGAIAAGRQIAKMPGLAIRLAVSSDLHRAMRTRDLVVQQLPNRSIPVRAIAGLREISYGVFAGMDEAQARRRYPEFFDDPQWKGDFVQKAPGGENYTNIDERLKRELDPLLDAETGDVLIVAHLHVLRVLLYRLFDLTRGQTCRLNVPNTKPNIIERGKPNGLVGEVTWEKLLPNDSELR